MADDRSVKAAIELARRRTHDLMDRIRQVRQARQVVWRALTKNNPAYKRGAS